MKSYPSAHLAAVAMSCFCAEPLQLLFPNSASGIARALPQFRLCNFKFPRSKCRPLVSLSDNLNPFQRKTIARITETNCRQYPLTRFFKQSFCLCE